MPYVIKTATEEEQLPVLNRLARGPIMQEATAKAPAVSRLRALDPNWFYGMRHLTTGKKQVVKVDDLKGMKISTPDAPLARLPMAALGAAVTPLSMQEVYSALQMGVVDGQENPINTIYTAKLYEVQKYITLTGHQTQNLCAIINEKFYQGLSPELRAIFEKSAIEAADYQSDSPDQGQQGESGGDEEEGCRRKHGEPAGVRGKDEERLEGIRGEARQGALREDRGRTELRRRPSPRGVGESRGIPAKAAR